ncbi:unnamed protein product [Didymodactylos carnosus]|uniref:E3 ubiquitin-protein ligase ZSWIM2 n=1 Tax=Didymodactylos carnosus TaxID=1234261 RepID=A0A814BG69_9BILA|nr:unnamed protein product [Didymodactylos carnosus]CAF0927940.1 unnamed protein product [Didymodactylos carnosus]CAF3565477.1 unnamed protein product [Didymodactylos carnosus]CAF3706315.1 unnamed protein product [Didymodactylos carnosus]
MSRSIPYRLECPEKCIQSQEEALSSTIYILRQTGPTAFVIKDEADTQRTYKVFLGDPHQCSCPSFQKDHELCKHLCWILLKRFRIPRTNSMLWQKSLVEREINEILRGLVKEEEEQRRKLVTNIKQKVLIKDDQSTDSEVEQRPISDHDVCPICQEEFLTKKLPITYCRHGCGNNVHVKCMKVWLDHQLTTGEKVVKCPLCREMFGNPDLLKQEFRTSGAQQAEKGSIHLGYSCHRCRACPISGKCYKCNTCQDCFLCQTCFNLNIHNEHSFDYREKSFQRWKNASRDHLTALPNAVHQLLVNRDITDNDYDLLLQLENAQNATVMGIPEKVVKSFPTERVHDTSRLLQRGEQCRLCLRSYQVGERVRRLPSCKHKFHIECIDGWLLHSHPTCPIDGQLVWSLEMELEQREVKRSATSSNNQKQTSTSTVNNNQTKAHSNGNQLLSVDLGLSVTPYQIRATTNNNNELDRLFLLPPSNRRLHPHHLRAPLRPLIQTATNDLLQPPLQINVQSLLPTTVLKRQNDLDCFLDASENRFPPRLLSFVSPACTPPRSRRDTLTDNEDDQQQQPQNLIFSLRKRDGHSAPHKNTINIEFDLPPRVPPAQRSMFNRTHLHEMHQRVQRRLNNK